MLQEATPCLHGDWAPDAPVKDLRVRFRAYLGASALLPPSLVSRLLRTSQTSLPGCKATAAY